METKQNEKEPKQKVVVFNELNEVQVADEGDAVFAFIINGDALKTVASGKVTLELLQSLKLNMPNILDRVSNDYKFKNGLK